MGWQVYDKYGAAKIAPASVQGSQLDYQEIVTPTAAITATTEGTSVAVITGNSVTYDGSQVVIEFEAPKITLATASTAYFTFWRDSTVIGKAELTLGGSVWAGPSIFRVKDTPPAGAHTYKVTAHVSGNNVVISAGPGGSGNLTPAYLRVTRADPQVVVKYVGVPGALLGQQLDYAQIVADVVVSPTTEATAVSVIPGNAVTYDGSKVKIEVFIPDTTGVASGGAIKGVLLRDTTVLGQFVIAAATTAHGGGTFVFFDTPPAGSHTYSLSAFGVQAGNTIKAGPGGSGNLIPASIRVTRAA